MSFSVVFIHFFEFSTNSEYFEHRHIGSNKKIYPCHLLKEKNSGNN